MSSVGSETSVLPARESTGLLEWLWRSAALRSARAQLDSSAQRRESLRRARLAAELADRTFESDDFLEAGSALPLVLTLYREAAFWAVSARADGAAFASEREAFDSPHFSALGGRLPESELALARDALDKSFIATAAEPLEALRRDARACQRYVRARLDEETVRERAVSRLLWQRCLRSGGFVLLALLGVSFALLKIEQARRGPDLALGKPWRASSMGVECHPETNDCGGSTTAIFFHTEDENEPWVEFDLGKVHEIGRVRVVNRDDCCKDRAVPLVIEVSEDQAKFRTVAQREDAFDSWDAQFDPTRARYVRLRVTRQTMLHLVSVNITER
jgi:hypothetical protein